MHKDIYFKYDNTIVDYDFKFPFSKPFANLQQAHSWWTVGETAWQRRWRGTLVRLPARPERRSTGTISVYIQELNE